MDEGCISWCLGWRGSVFRGGFVLKANAQVRWRCSASPSVQVVAAMGDNLFPSHLRETALAQGKRDQLKEKEHAKCHHRVHTLRPKLRRDR